MANRLSFQLPFGNKSHSGPHQPVPLADGSVHTLSSFGLDHTTLGPDWDAKGLINSVRKKTLDYRSRYYQCTQHDHKTHDWNGRMTSKSTTIAGIQPLIGNSAPGQYVTMENRRPNAPYRLGRVIVNAFTTMLFGYGRWPAIKSEDADTQDFVEALNKASKLHTKMLRARAIGGGCGTVGLSWKFSDGKPRVSVHSGKNIFIKEWEDEDEGTPSHVIEIYTVVRDVRVERGKVERKEFWKRRDWTPLADVVFHDVQVGKENPAWSIDEERSYVHNDKFCHFVWVRNFPEEEPGIPDGQPDYAEVYEQLNTLDILNSIVCKGGILNLDPTLIVKMSPEELGNAAIKKGSENALAVGETGDARYMELSGTSITSGLLLVDKQRDQILETAQCVILDPNEAAAQGTSSVAMKVMYAPMIGQTDILRDQYGEAIVRLNTQMLEHCRSLMPIAGAENDSERYLHEVVTDEEGNPTGEEPVDYFVSLPPRIETEQVFDDDGNPTGEEETHEYERVPGKGDVELEWGEYFRPTALDRQQTSGSLIAATAGKPVMSQRTAVDIFADTYGKDGAAEWVELSAEQKLRSESESEMFPPMGGEVENENDLPDGALPDDEMPDSPDQKLELPPAVIEAVITVDEARSALGHAPLGGADGKLTIAAFKAQSTAQGAETGKVVGAAEGKQAVQPPETEPVPPATGGALPEQEQPPAETPPVPPASPTDGTT